MCSCCLFSWLRNTLRPCWRFFSSSRWRLEREAGAGARRLAPPPFPCRCPRCWRPHAALRRSTRSWTRGAITPSLRSPGPGPPATGTGGHWPNSCGSRLGSQRSRRSWKNLEQRDGLMLRLGNECHGGGKITNVFFLMIELDQTCATFKTC